MDLKKIKCGDVDWINLVEVRCQWWSPVKPVMNLSSRRGVVYTDKLNNNQLLMKNSCFTELVILEIRTMGCAFIFNRK
jgi:hypothetical protein